MTEILKDACLSYPNGLAIFDRPVLNVGLKNTRCIQYLPTNDFTNQSCIEFHIPGTSTYYTDLKKTKLSLSCKIVKKDGSNIVSSERASATSGTTETTSRAASTTAAAATTTTKTKAIVGVVDNFLSSMFSRCDVMLQDRTMTSSDHTYPYRAYLTNVLFRSQEQKDTNLKTELFYQDEAKNMREVNTVFTDCVSVKERAALFADSQEVDLVGELYTDMTQGLDRYIPSGVSIKIKLYPSAPEFCLISPETDPQYKIQITKAHLKVTHAELNSEILVAHDQILKDTCAIFPYMKTLVKQFTLPSQIYTYQLNDVFLGNAPSELFICLVKESSQYGSFSENPYAIENAKLSYLQVTVDGVELAPNTLQPKYGATVEKSNFVEAYDTLKDIGNPGGCIPVSKDNFFAGYSIYRYFAEPSEFAESGAMPLKRKGIVRITMNFAEKLAHAMTMIVYAKFPSAFQIDSSRAVYDV